MWFNRIETIGGIGNGPEVSVPITQRNQGRVRQLREYALRTALASPTTQNVDLIDLNDMMQLGRGLGRRFGDKAVKTIVYHPDSGDITIFIRGAYLALDQHNQRVLVDAARGRVLDPDSDIRVTFLRPVDLFTSYSVHVSGPETRLEAFTQNAPQNVHEAMITG